MRVPILWNVPPRQRVTQCPYVHNNGTFPRNAKTRLPTAPHRTIMKCIKGKGKVRSKADHEGPEGEQRYSSTLSLTSALDGVGGQLHATAAFPPPRKTRYTLYRRLGGP